MTEDGINDADSPEVQETELRLLGRRMKAGTSKIAFSQMLPVWCMGMTRQA